MNNDLTAGKPGKLILMFTLPLLIGNLFQQFYSMADTIIVGRTIDVYALAAVGATGAIAFLILGFVQGVTSGFSVITAQRVGAQDEQGVRRSVATSILLSVGVTIIFTILSVLTARPLLELMQTPADIIDDAYNYIIVIYYGIAASVFFNLFSSIVRALGDSRTPLIFLIVACIINIALDFVCILVFRMGVAGAGWATIIAQAVSAVLCLLYSLKRFPVLRLHREDWAFSWRFAWQHLRIGLPMAFQFSVTAIGVMIMQAALNSFGSTTVAAFTAASKIENIVSQPFNSLGVTVSVFAAQNYGAGRIARIREGVRKSTLFSLIWSVFGAILVVFAGRPLIRLFVGDASATVFDQAQYYLDIMAVFLFALGQLFIYRNILQGVGKGGMPLAAGFAELVMRALAAFVLTGALGYLGVCLANPIAWIGAAVPLAIAYFIYMHKMKKNGDRIV